MLMVVTDVFVGVIVRRSMAVIMVMMVVLMIMVMTMAVSMMMVVTMTVFVAVRAFLTTYMYMSTLSRVQYLYLNQIEEEGQYSDTEHDRANDFGWFEESACGLIYQESSHYPYYKDGAESTEDFHPMVPKCILFICSFMRDMQGENRNSKAEYVRSDMCCI